MHRLAINGGRPVRTKPFPSMTTIGKEEREAVLKLMVDGEPLSAYRGNSGPNFLGGEQVQALEREFAEKFNVKYAIAVNSCTSALQVACGAIGLAPGDEVIVTPWSMSCSATAPLLWNAIPIFADIEEDCYCLDPDSIEERITPRTKAIIVVDLFGQPYDVERINEIAKKHNLSIIEDAAQAIGSFYCQKRWAGTFGDIGVFSFTTGKIITAGEGGMIITDDLLWAQRCRLIRNHAESVLNDAGYPMGYPGDSYHYANMLGFNLRMTEIQATILKCQLEKLESIIQIRAANAGYIRSVEEIPAISEPKIRDDCYHVFYAQAFKWDKEKADGIHRNKFIEAVKAELTPEAGRENERVRIGCGYIKPLYLFPIFQQRRLYGGTGVPWSYSYETLKGSEKNYKLGSCPVAERLWKDELFVHTMLGMNLSIDDLDDFCDAFHKVWKYREELK